MKSSKKLRSVLALATILSSLAASVPSLADVDPDILEARRQKSYGGLTFLTYRHLDELFDARVVPAGPKPRPFQRSHLSLPDTVGFVDAKGERIELPQFMAAARVNAILVLKDGKLVREIYRNGGGPSSRYAAFSVSKSVLSILTGIALEDGAITSIDDLVTKYVPELRGTAYEGVTLRQLLRMRSGTSWTEDYAPGSELDLHRDLSVNAEKAFYEDYARKVTRRTEPGTVFNYSSLDSEILGTVLAKAVGRPLSEYLAERVWKPAGMEAPAAWVLQGPTGRQHEWYAAGFTATLRDFGRLGQLMLDGGMAGRRAIVPRTWVDASTRPENGDTGYFYQWWGVGDMDGFGARGTYGQRIYVDRPSRTVVVMTGYGRTARAEPELADPMARAIVAHLTKGG